MRKVMFALAIVAGAFMTAGPASAQCSYAMNDVGRFHGHLSGPCNGAAVGYSGAYPYHPNARAGAHPTVVAPKVITQTNGHNAGARGATPLRLWVVIAVHAAQDGARYERQSQPR